MDKLVGGICYAFGSVIWYLSIGIFVGISKVCQGIAGIFNKES